MSRVIANCVHLIDWAEVIAHLEDTNPAITKRGQPEFWMRSKELDPNYPTFPGEEEHDKAIYEMWKLAGYNFGSADWTVFRAGDHYSHEVDRIIAKYLNIEVNWSSLNQVDPGCNVPPHTDPDENPKYEIERKVRFIMQINKSSPGQSLILGDECFHNLRLGDIIQWDNPHMLHAASNCGLETAYYYSIEGLRIQ